MPAEVLEKLPEKTKTLGPVADLEKHLPSEWWKTLFNSLYLKTDGDVVENHENTAREVGMLIEAVGLKKNDSILDLCCGQGRHTIELHRRGYRQAGGLDRSRYLIRLARKRAQQNALDIRFSEGDARSIRLPESSMDCVVLFGNSFGYFESRDEDLAVLRSILRVLKSEGFLVLDVVNGEWMRRNFEPRSWEWIDEMQFVCRERSLSADASRIISREVIVHAEKGVIADQFYAERLYDQEEISEILSALNFSQVVFHEEVVANSTRKQDLGMMANRMFISARAPVKRKKTNGMKTSFSMTVLLGDPSLPDLVKRNGQFNTEDFETIQKLKNALSELPYVVEYVDDHSKLIARFSAKKPKFVFNLCDEGFFNHATREMHVPAFLEMLNIPYSGASPASLAMCYDKSIVRSVALSMEIPVPLETFCHYSDQTANLPSIFPALIKPSLGDSSIGITQDAVVHDSTSLMACLEKLKSQFPNIPLLVQEYLSGAEYTVGVIGNPGNYLYLPILTVDYSDIPEGLPKILGYESKWMPDSVYWKNIRYIPAKLDLDTERKLIDYSTMLFERLGCRDYARFDFRADDSGEIKLLEVNPNPGWCWDGKLNLMADLAGKSYADLLELILKAAIDRMGGMEAFCL